MVSRPETMTVERELGGQGVDDVVGCVCEDVWYLVCKYGDRAADHNEKRL
jgi:hypothetical protein